MTKEGSNKLKDVIEEVKRKIEDHERVYRNNEQATTIQLILPILKGLGWNVESHEDVHPHYGSNCETDLSLKHKGETKVLIEAKALGEGFYEMRRGETPAEQLARYCGLEDVSYGILTDGRKWKFHIWNEREKQLKEVWDLNLKKDLDSFLFYIRKLSKENIETLDEEIELKTKMNKIWEKGMEKIKETAEEEEISFAKYSSQKKDIKKFFKNKRNELNNVCDEEYFKKEKYEPPTVSRDVDKEYSGEMEINGETIRLKEHKYEVLTRTVKWAIDNGHLVKEDLPIRKGVPGNNENNDFLISSSPDDTSRMQQVEDIFVFTGLNKENIEKEAKYLLTKIDLDDFKLKVKNWPKES